MAMKKYRIWLTKKNFIDVEAVCPTEALKAIGCKYYWDIQRIKE